MAYLPGMSEHDANKLATVLIEKFTPNDVLQEDVEVTGIDGVFLNASVCFEVENGKKWFDMVLTYGDLTTQCLASVSSRHLVLNGTPYIDPKLYRVNVMRGHTRSRDVAGRGVVAKEIHDRIIGEQHQDFQAPMYRALQLLERVELGLKHKFES